jgi:adenosine deaminase
VPYEGNLSDILTVSKECKDLNEYLGKFDFPLRLMQTKQAVAECVEDLLMDLEKKGLMYCEIRFAPQLHTKKGLSQEDVILAAIDGMNCAKEKLGDRLYAGLILCCMRGSDNAEQNEETVRLAAKYLDRGICGLDLAGAEGLYPTRDYKALFELADSLHVPFTIHAGEAAGADSVRSAVLMGAKRIGHGIHSLEDEELLSILKEKNIILELCPTSNLNTKAVDKPENYPLLSFLKAGVKVTVNTDNMTVSDTDIRSEYRLLEETFGIDFGTIRHLLQNAVEASFAAKELKLKLQKRLKEDFDFYCIRQE